MQSPLSYLLLLNTLQAPSALTSPLTPNPLGFSQALIFLDYSVAFDPNDLHFELKNELYTEWGKSKFIAVSM